MQSDRIIENEAFLLIASDVCLRSSYVHFRSKLSQQFITSVQTFLSEVILRDNFFSQAHKINTSENKNIL